MDAPPPAEWKQLSRGLAVGFDLGTRAPGDVTPQSLGRPARHRFYAPPAAGSRPASGAVPRPLSNQPDLVGSLLGGTSLITTHSRDNVISGVLMVLPARPMPSRRKRYSGSGRPAGHHPGKEVEMPAERRSVLADADSGALPGVLPGYPAAPSGAKSPSAGARVPVGRPRLTVPQLMLSCRFIAERNADQ